MQNALLDKIKNLKPKPSYVFYDQYVKTLQKMQKASKVKIDDNAAFMGFLMIGMEDEN